MATNKKTLFFTLLLLLLVIAATVVALRLAKKDTTQHLVSSNNHTPDFFMTDIVYTQLDQDGKVHNQVYASKITHFSDDNSYLFDNPHMKLFDNNEEPWNISADKGKSEHGKAKVYLWDNVKIQQLAGANNMPTLITTTALTVFPTPKYAETDKPVTIVQGDSTAQAVGATADFKTGVVKLQSQVTGQYK